MASHYFQGFSTQDSLTTRQRTFYDVELIKRDLINHFNTRVGERVMRPTWGCKIWDYMMEQFTPDLRDKIVSEAVAVCAADTRVAVVSINVVEFDMGVRVELTLDFRPLNVVETFAVDFERRENARWNSDII
jgi:phage baseplate assembly protein W